MENSRDKQIEEMGEYIAEVSHLECGIKPCEECKWCGSTNPEKADCMDYLVAEKLIAKGYRKASEVAEEVIRKVEQIVEVEIIGIEEDFFHGTAAHWDATRKKCYEEILVELAELKKKYTEEGK